VSPGVVGSACVGGVRVGVVMLCSVSKGVVQVCRGWGQLDTRNRLRTADHYSDLCLLCPAAAACCQLSALPCSYPVVVGSVLGLFSCKQLDSAASVPGEVNAAVGKFWTRVSDRPT
jgi:hypothetical protein